MGCREKILSVAGFLLLCSAIIVAVVTPSASNYELSIYAAYPGYFWVLLLGATTVGIVSAFNLVLSPGGGVLRFFQRSILIVLCNVFLISLPSIRGYYLPSNSDLLSHLGWIGVIVRSGHVEAGDFYPITHILGAQIVDVLGVSTRSLSNFMGVVFELAYLGGMYFLGVSISQSRVNRMLLFFSGIPLVFSYYMLNVYPFVLGIVLVPLLFALILRKRDLMNTIMGLVVSIVITFVHPIVAFFAVLALVCIQLNNVLCRDKRNYLSWIGVLSFAAFAWYFSFAVIGYDVRSVYTSVTKATFQSPILAQQRNLVRVAHLRIWQELQFGVLKYGLEVIWILFSAGLIVALLLRAWRDRDAFFGVNSALVFTFVAALVLSALMYTNNMILTDPTRVLFFPVLVGMIMIASIINTSFPITRYGENGHKKPTATGNLVLMIVISTSLLGVFKLFQSPLLGWPNPEVQRTAILGTKWVLNRGDPELPIMLNTQTLFDRFDDFLYGPGYREVRMIEDNSRLPSHFGLYDGKLERVVLNSPKYIELLSYDREVYRAFPEQDWSKAYQFSHADILRFNAVPGVNELYSSGGFLLWEVDKDANGHKRTS